MQWKAERHTALLVKAFSAGQAMFGVICWKQTQKHSPFKQKTLKRNRGTWSAAQGGRELGLIHIGNTLLGLTEDTLVAALLTGHAVVVVWILHLP